MCELLTIPIAVNDRKRKRGEVGLVPDKQGEPVNASPARVLRECLEYLPLQTLDVGSFVVGSSSSRPEVALAAASRIFMQLALAKATTPPRVRKLSHLLTHSHIEIL